MHIRILLLFLPFFLFAGLFQPCLAAEDGQLIKTVILSRHGVRSPTQDARILAMWSQKTWPHWPVDKGELTERGAGLVTQMWKNMRARYSDLQLLPANGCPNPELVYVRADVDERTKATARAILDGLLPGCPMGFAVIQDKKVDPLFHPVKAGLYRINPLAGATDVIAMTGGGLSTVQDEFSGTLATIGSILGEPAPSLCSRFAMLPNCEISDLPNAVSISPDGKEIRLVGALSIASSVAEIFLLEYAQWPGGSAGWGQVTEKVLEQILPVHAKVFDIVNRAPVVAWAKGSSLLTEMSAALTNSHYDSRCNDAKIVIFVGHDTNIANVGALLNAQWQAEGYPPNGIPPAGAIALELWEKGGVYQVVARFFAQNPKSLHTPLPQASANALPEFAPVERIVVSPPAIGELRYTVDEFLTFVKNVTEGAPLAPRENPPLNFGKVVPNH